jgi:uncharacterized radical SAM superfamily Fe-S cluster-containing enzyme
VVEVTQRCDVGCATCSASSIISGSEPELGDLVARASAAARKIGAGVIALSGGEPLMRPDIWEIADAFHRTVPKVVLITSGRNFETEPVILYEIAARSAWLEVYLQFDSLRDSILRSIRTPRTTAALRKLRLSLAVGTGAPTTAVCVVPPESAEESIGELAAYARSQGAAGITFQPLRQLGRFPVSSAGGTRLATIDYIQALALRAVGADVTVPTPFIQQPFDIAIAFLAEGRTSTSDLFFPQVMARRFRVATSSYWDYTNYFEPFATPGPFYFYTDTGSPLNTRYFAAGERAAASRHRLYG